MVSSQDIKGYRNSLSQQGIQVQSGLSPAQCHQSQVAEQEFNFHLIICVCVCVYVCVFVWVHTYVCMHLHMCLYVYVGGA